MDKLENMLEPADHRPAIASAGSTPHVSRSGGTGMLKPSRIAIYVVLEGQGSAAGNRAAFVTTGFPS